MEKKIRVRIMSRIDPIQHDMFVFDADGRNSFRANQLSGSPSMYAKYLSVSDIQTDSTTNAVELDTINATARIGFVAGDSPSDYSDLALGYGLYYICIEYPFLTCTVPYIASWNRSSWIVDLRDSRYSRDYGNGNDGVIQVRIQIRWQDEMCGPATIDLEFNTPGRSEPLIATSRSIVGDNYGCNTPIPVHLLFEQDAPHFDFIIDNDIYNGLDSSDFNTMSRHLELTHSATINTDISLAPLRRFGIANSYNGLFYHIDRDSVNVTLNNRCSVTSSGSSIGFFEIRGGAGNPIRICNSNPFDLVGFNLNGVDAIIANAVITSTAPVEYYGTATGRSLAMLNTRLLMSEIDGAEEFVFDEQPYALRTENALVSVDSCVIRPADSSLSNGTGVLIKNAYGGSVIKHSLVESFPGHGIEIVDGPEVYDSTSSNNMFRIESNTIQSNRLYGVHIRGGNAMPLLRANVVRNNGWFGRNTEEEQSRKFDGINVFSSRAVIIRNTVDSNGAYGAHAAFSAKIESHRFDTTDAGKNCFKGNYYNLGSSLSVIELGKDSLHGGNSFVGPRATWSLPYHVTIDNRSRARIIGNAWESPSSGSNVLVLAQDSSIYDASSPYYGEPILCTTSYVPKYIRSDYYPITDQMLAIGDAIVDEDWVNVRDLSFQLLHNAGTDYEAGFATSSLMTAFRESSDPAIPVFLGIEARDTLRSIPSFHAGVAAAIIYSNVSEYDSSIYYTDNIAQRNLYSSTWRMANIFKAFVLSDCLGYYYAAEDVLMSVLQYYPDDSQALGAFYSIKGQLPVDFMKRNRAVSNRALIDMSYSSFDVYPNPTRSTLNAVVRVGSDANVEISMFDISTRRKYPMMERVRLTAGQHEVVLKTELIPPGHYHVIVTVNEEVLRRIVRIDK